MSGKKILMLVGEFSEEYEIFVFEQAMHAVGHFVDVVCPDKKAGEAIKTSLHDFEGDQTYTEKPGHLYTLNKTFSKVKPEEYDAVYIAGGRGPEYIRIDKRVQDIVRHFHGAGKPIFAICHGVQVLMAVGRFEGAPGRGAPILRARSAPRRRRLCRRGADRRLRRRKPCVGQRLAWARCLHARMPEGARDHRSSRKDCAGAGAASRLRQPFRRKPAIAGPAEPAPSTGPDKALART
jgi:putative intracellular protease/amidase